MHHPVSPSSEYLINSITNALKTLADSIPMGSRNLLWTVAIKRALAQLGDSLSYTVCAGGMAGECEPEWLYDIVWYKDDDLGRLHTIYLVAESEWDDSWKGIKYDFEKLLVARCPMKLMIFQVADSKRSSVFAQLEAAIDAYGGGGTGESYILACFSDALYNFDVRIIER